MSKHLACLVILLSFSLIAVSCAEKDPVADPILNPRTFIQDPFVESISFGIISGFDVRYTYSLSQAAAEPDCSSSGFQYSGPFLIGGPNETVSIKAIACDEGDQSEVVSGTYIFGN